ncbi:hypothetical protein PSPO01_14147 [Paraphaeosphaeria sporulosa]
MYTSLFPPAPKFTEERIIDLSGRVYMTISATSGTGLALAKILYGLHATVYIGVLLISLHNFQAARNTITASDPTSLGTLKPFLANLADLATVKPAVDCFRKENHRLDVLFLNLDGTAESNDGDPTMRTDCLAPFLLT